MFADVIDQPLQRVVRGIDRPDDLVEGARGLAGGLGNLLGVGLHFVRQILVRLHQFTEQGDLGEARADLVVNVPRDPGAFLFQRLLLFQDGELALELLRGEIMHDARHECAQAQRRCAIKPPSPPERGPHDHRERDGRFVPHVVLIARGDVEVVVPGIKLHVPGEGVVPGLRPALLVTFQPVAEADPVRRTEVQPRELNLQPLLAGLQGDASLQAARPEAGGHRLVVHQHRVNGHERRDGIGREPRRVHGHHALDGGEP